MNELIIKFYSAFAKGDWQTMAGCYHEQAIFIDPVFINLKSKEIGAMWRMLIERSGGKLEIAFNNIVADTEKGKAEWVAEYYFSATGRHVINRIHAEFEFKEGKIFRHTDTFDFHKWAGQALGIKGKLLGNFPFFRKKLQKTARMNLDKFMT